MKKLTAPLQSERSRDDGRPVLDLLAEIPIERLEEVVAQLNGKRQAAEVCDALMKRIALAPISQFQMLRDIYHKQCAPASG